MSKGLEALGKLTSSQNLTMYEQNECLKIIEEELKEYEMMKQTQFIVVDKEISDDDLEKLKNQGILVDNLDEVKPLFDEETKKKLKAFEIIKNKMVDVGKLFYCYESLEEYNKWVSEKDKLTQEEFDLLKEELLWKQ